MKHLSAILTIGLVAITTTAARGEVDAVKEDLKAPSASTTITLSPVSMISPTSYSPASTVSPAISASSTVSTASTRSTEVNLASGDSITTIENLHPATHPWSAISNVAKPAPVRTSKAIRHFISFLKHLLTFYPWRLVTVWQFTGDICNGLGKKTLIAGGQFGDPAWQSCYPLDDDPPLIWLEEVEGCVVTSAQESCSIPLDFDTWMTPGLCSNIEITGRTHTMLWYRCDGM